MSAAAAPQNSYDYLGPHTPPTPHIETTQAAQASGTMVTQNQKAIWSPPRRNGGSM